MNIEFKRSIKSLVDERLEVIRIEFVSSNKGYIRLNDRCKRLQNEIDKVTESLPDDVKKLFLLNEDFEASLESMLQKAIYRNGLRDGIRLANVCRKVIEL